uniref:Uncharacterized protein n=1 Tax=Mycena chlorophos TaxID=658473 RepID=A0ABQ0LRA2_MYCCL|nr:predicted protein [Mycena chlorophos]
MTAKDEPDADRMTLTDYSEPPWSFRSRPPPGFAWTNTDGATSPCVYKAEQHRRGGQGLAKGLSAKPSRASDSGPEPTLVFRRGSITLYTVSPVSERMTRRDESPIWIASDMEGLELLPRMPPHRAARLSSLRQPPMRRHFPRSFHVRADTIPTHNSTHCRSWHCSRTIPSTSSTWRPFSAKEAQTWAPARAAEWTIRES